MTAMPYAVARTPFERRSSMVRTCHEPGTNAPRTMHEQGTNALRTSYEGGSSHGLEIWISLKPFVAFALSAPLREKMS